MKDNLHRFSGAVATVRISGSNLEVQTLLGSGFVINAEKALVATCYHVLPEQDRNFDVGFFCKDHSGAFFSSIIDTASIQRWGEEDLIVFQCIGSDNKPRRGMETFRLSEKEIDMAEKVIFTGMPKNHMKISAPGDTHVTSRVIVGFVSAVYDTTAEISSPIIKFMSGGAVLNTQSEIIGMAIKNIRLGLDPELIADESEDDDGNEKVVYQYREYQKFARFYQLSAFGEWLNSVSKNYGYA